MLVVTLLVIVVMYLLCNIPRLSLNTAEYLIRDKVHQLSEHGCEQVPEWFFILIRISHLFLIINTSANFIIYFAVCKKFKSVLRNQIREIKQKVFPCC